MSNPQAYRPTMVILTERETQRVARFFARVGTKEEAAQRLGVGVYTFDAARGYGRMQSTTRERVLAALDREEAGNE